MTGNMSRSFLRVASALAVLLPTAGSFGCGEKGGAQTRRVSAGAVAVRVATVAVQDVVYEIKALGSLEAEELVQITGEVEGAVSEVTFHEGDRVTPETVLLRIDPERYRLEAEQAEATYKRACAERDRAEADRVRREQLAQEHLVAAEDLNRSRAEAERAAAEAEASRAARDLARQSLRKAEVRPPRAGVINTRAVELGQYVREGTLLATLVDVSRLRLRFKVSEAESLRARQGQGQIVTFRVSSLGDRDFKARIYHVGEVADTATRQVEVVARVDNPGPLRPGFFAEATLASETRKGALVLPEGAVQASERGFVAYVVEQDKARLRQVQVGLRTGSGRVEILSGLKAGETVVVEGSDRLADGVAVQVASEPGARRSGQGGQAGGERQ